MGRLYLAIAFFLAGTSVVAAGFLADHLPAFTTTFLSLFFASLTAALISGRGLYQAARKLTRNQWRIIFLQAFFGTFLFRAFLTLGLSYIGAAEAGIITGTAPALTAVCAWFLLKEPVSAHTLAGVGLSLFGLFLVQGGSLAVEPGLFELLGLILVVSAAACEAIFTILARLIHMSEDERVDLPPVIQAGLVSLVATLLCLGPMLWEKPWGRVAALPVSGWLALVWYGAIVTIVAFAFMFAGAKRCGGYTIASFTALIPVSSLILSVILLGEKIGPAQIFGCVAVVLATFVISRRPGKGFLKLKPRAWPSSGL